MTDLVSTNPPSPFIARWVPRVFVDAPGARPRALDVATGRGRHAVVMAAAGFRVIAIDIQFDAVADAARTARASGLDIAAVCADLTSVPLPRDYFHLIVVTRYLDRTAFPALRDALVPGGVLLYETFTTRQREHGRGPTSRAHLLDPGELRQFARGMDLLFDEECLYPEALARIAARRR
jgi:SAM-dependent methyltransferase